MHADLAIAEVAEQAPRAAQPDMPQRVAAAMEATKSFLTGFSVRTKILGIIVTLTMVFGVGITLQVRSVMRSELLTEMDQQGSSLAIELASRAETSLAQNDGIALSGALSGLVEHHPDAAYAYVVDGTGEVRFHTFGADGVPADLSVAEVGSFDDAKGHRLVLDGTTTYREYEAPLVEGGADTLRVGLTADRLMRRVDGVTTQMLATTAFVALVAVAAASFLTWMLTRPVVELVDTTRRVADGDLSARAPHYADDEIGSLAEAFNLMVADLEANRETLAETEAARTRLLEQLITAQEEERKRIARELHDTVGQSLSSIMLGVAVLNRLDGDEAVDKSGQIQQLAGETLMQVRDLSRELRPSALDDLGLAAALERYGEDYSLRHRDVTTDIHTDLSTRLPPAVETALYRIIQEAMANATRHGGAANVSILVVQRDETIRVIVEDDGSGFDTEAVRRRGTSVGIHAMRERAELLGGRFEIESGPNGTTVYVEIPS